MDNDVQNPKVQVIERVKQHLDELLVLFAKIVKILWNADSHLDREVVVFAVAFVIFLKMQVLRFFFFKLQKKQTGGNSRLVKSLSTKKKQADGQVFWS